MRSLIAVRAATRCQNEGCVRATRLLSTDTTSSNESEAQRIMGLAANRATRYVFLRTLPLSSEHALAEDAKNLAADIEADAKRVVAAHEHRAVDERAAVHLHTAALAVATHRVLAPRLRSDARAEAMIRAAFGAAPAGDVDDAAARRLPAYWISRAALWFAPNRLAATRRMAANTARDFGSSFDVELRDGVSKDSHHLVVRECTLFRAGEGFERLLACFARTQLLTSCSAGGFGRCVANQASASTTLFAKQKGFRTSLKCSVRSIRRFSAPSQRLCMGSISDWRPPSQTSRWRRIRRSMQRNRKNRLKKTQSVTLCSQEYRKVALPDQSDRARHSFGHMRMSYFEHKVGVIGSLIFLMQRAASTR
eukprot:IDg6052t1